MEDRFKWERQLRKASRYRGMARYMRELANQETAIDVRKAMIVLAESYDELCNQLIDPIDRGRDSEMAVLLERAVPRGNFN